MKIYASHFLNSFKNKEYACFFLYGKEPAQIEYHATQLIEYYIKLGFERQFYLVDNSSHFDWSQILQALSTFSLFSKSNLIELFIPHLKFNKEVYATLAKCVELAHLEARLIFRTHEIDSSLTKQAWWKALDDKGLIINHPQLNERNSFSWLKTYAVEHEISISDQALNYLQTQCLGNLIRARQHLDCMRLLPNHKNIDVDTLSSIIHNDSHYSVYEVCDQALSGHHLSISSISLLLENSALFPLIIWNLNKILSELYTLMTSPIEFEKLQIWANRKTLYYKANERLTINKVKNFIHLLFDAEKNFKQGEQRLAKENLNTVLIRLSQSSLF